jgi:hypothetical protein
MKEITRYACSYCTQVFDDAERCREHEAVCEYNTNKFKKINGTLWSITFSLATGQYESPDAYHHTMYQDDKGNYWQMSCGRLVTMDCDLDVPEVSAGQYGKHKLFMYTTRRGTTSIRKELIAYLNDWAKERAQNIVDKGMKKADIFCRGV